MQKPWFEAAQVTICAAAKINLTLRIVSRRPDGYHVLDSLVAPIALYDQVHVQIRPAGSARVTTRVAPPRAAPIGSDNLATRAAADYLTRRGIAAEVEIELHKRIPIGAGLGGGSSDAAAVIRGLNAVFEPPLPGPQLAAWALELGADVPLFLFGRPARMTGIGEQLQPVALPIAPLHPIVVVFCGTGLATRDVYRRYDSLTSADTPSRVRRFNPGHGLPADWLVNDLEIAAFQERPELAKVKRRLCALGADGAVMTGSGAAIVGVWERDRWEDARAAAGRLRADGLWACASNILERVPAVERDEQHGGRSPSW